MLHLRRYRVFVVFTVFLFGTLYHFTSVKDWQSVRTTSVDSLKQWSGSGSQDTKIVSTDRPVVLDAQDELLDPNAKSTFASTSESTSASTSESTSTGISISHTGMPIPTEKPEVPVGRFGEFAMGGEGRHEAKAKPLPERPAIHWSRMSEHFPVPIESIIPLPSGTPVSIPTIQFAFKDESTATKISREEKQATIREAFEHSWKGYKDKAWKQDELSPVSGRSRNPFCGWAATLVDSLDTLWIMGMESEFKNAVEAVGTIDFTTSPRKDIPLFETTIRYLGGMLAAYDLSEGKYPVLLKKSVELGDVLLAAFDTPNRMPVTYYYWRPTFAVNPHRASSRVVMAELGSLSVEFTRLAQLTKEAKYYDAIARITNEFEIWQNKTKIPGLWPLGVDASGCKKPDVSEPMWLTTDGTGAKASSSTATAPVNNATAESIDVTEAKSNKKAKRQLDENDVESSKIDDEEHSMMIEENTEPEKVDCIPQGLNSPPGAFWEEFTLGGRADSTFEYLPKQHMLLGGLNTQYQSMYEKVVKAADKHLLYRPMIPDGRDVLILGTAEVIQNLDVELKINLKPEHTHLTCFAGGMWGIGSKIFDRPEDLEIAKKLTDGCVWAYEATATGIMPETMRLIPCEERTSCTWNETRWFEHLDPHRLIREASYAQTRMMREKLGAQADVVTASTPTAAADSISEPTVPEQPVEPVSPMGPTKPESPMPPTAPEGKYVEAKAPLSRRQLGSIDNDKPVNAIKTQPEPKIVDTLPTKTSVEENEFPTHEEFVQKRIEEERIPIGIPSISSTKYILRPEAIESVFIMYRITGDEIWRERGWRMFESINDVTKAEYGYSAIGDVTDPESYHLDEMESFWTAETLKYFYLLFSPSSLISLDEYVLNTEAHPFKRPS